MYEREEDKGESRGIDIWEKRAERTAAFFSLLPLPSDLRLVMDCVAGSGKG